MSDMNEQLKEKLLDMMNAVENGLPTAESYAATIMDQAWTVMLLENMVGMLALLCISVVLLSPMIIMEYQMRNPQKYPKGTFFIDFRHYDGGTTPYREEEAILISVVSSAASIIFVVAFMFCFIDIIKLFVAPEMMVLQYLTNMM